MAENDAPERIRLIRDVNGLLRSGWYYPDAAIGPYHSAIQYVRADLAAPDAAQPLCAVHQKLEDEGKLEVEIGNNCVACSLHERTQLLRTLAPHVPPDKWVDSVGFLKLKLQQLTKLANTAIPDAVRQARRCDVCDLLENSPSHNAGICNCAQNGQCHCRFAAALRAEGEREQDA